MARTTVSMRIRRFMESHEPSVLSVEFNKGDGYRLILVWPERNKTWFVRGYGEDYVSALADTWEQVSNGRRREYRGEV